MPAVLHAPGGFCGDRQVQDMHPGLTCQPAPLYTGAALVSPAARPVFRWRGPRPAAAAAQAHPAAARSGQASRGSLPEAVVCPTASGPLRESSADMRSAPPTSPIHPCPAAALLQAVRHRNGRLQRCTTRLPAQNGTAPATVGMEPASAESAHHPVCTSVTPLNCPDSAAPPPADWPSLRELSARFGKAKSGAEVSVRRPARAEGTSQAFAAVP